MQPFRDCAMLLATLVLGCSSSLVNKPVEDMTDVPANSSYLCLSGISDSKLLGGDASFSLMLTRMDADEDEPRELLLLMDETNQTFDGVFAIPAGRYHISEAIAGPYDPLFGRSGAKEASLTGRLQLSQSLEVKAGQARFLGLMNLLHEEYKAMGFKVGCPNPQLEARFRQKLGKSVTLTTECLKAGLAPQTVE